MIDKRVHRKELQDRIEHLGDTVSVSSHDPLSMGLGGKVAVGQNDLVPVPHSHQHGHQFG